MVVSGTVADRQTRQPLKGVSITAEGGHEQTVTNADGFFTLKTDRQPRYVQLSHIGYKTRRQQLDGTKEGLTILMVPYEVKLSEVIIQPDDPEAILRAAIARFDQNYSQQTELLRGFYRETARRRSRFISVAEAVLDIYKTSYVYGTEHDAVGIVKGRRLMGLKARDTLGVKMQGGPMLPVMLDVVKNRPYLLCEEELSAYQLSMAVPERIDDQLHYVIRMEPRTVRAYPLMHGLLYINQETLALTRAELSLDMSDRRKATDYLVVRKPAGLRVKPVALTIQVNYLTDGGGGVTRLNYMRSEMQIGCDWKRRLFNAPFVLVSEMVVTDRLPQVQRPKGRAAFGMRDRFYDRVEYFDDAAFWADYNIIEPTESLEHAIGKLKKRVGKQ